MNYAPRYDSYPGYSTVYRSAPQQPPSAYAKYNTFNSPPRRQHFRTGSHGALPSYHQGPPPAYYPPPTYTTRDGTYIYEPARPAEPVRRQSQPRPRTASRRPSMSGTSTRVFVSTDSKQPAPKPARYHDIDEGYSSPGKGQSPPPPYDKHRSGTWVADSYPQTSYKAPKESPPKQRSSSSTRQRSASYSASTPRPKSSSKPKAPRQATAADAAKAQIPAGYHYKNWDPTEEPILLLGSVFDANSLGKWIYDFTVFHHGAGTPMADMAGDLWLLLIQLSGKIKRAEECLGRIRRSDDKRLVQDFLDSGERIWTRFNRILKSCENFMYRVAQKDAKHKGTPSKLSMGAQSGCAFVDTIFGRDRELVETEKLMTGMRLWSHRFDVNCEDIMRHPAA